MQNAARFLTETTKGRIGGWQVDPHRGTIALSQTARGVFGLGADETIATPGELLARIHADDLCRVTRAFGDTAETALNLICRIKALDGVTRVVHLRADPITLPGQVTVLVGQVRDMTDARQDEEQASDSAADLMRLAGKAARFGAWRVSFDDQMVHFTETTLAILEEGPEAAHQPVGAAYRYYDPDSHERMRQLSTACAQHGVGYSEEVEIVTAKGNRLWVREIGEAERDAAGRITGMRGAFQDISEMVRTRDRAATASRLLRLAGRVTRVGGWSVNLADESVSWTDEVAQMHDEPPGYAPDYNGGIDYFAPDHQEDARRVFVECAKRGTPFDNVRQIITRKGRRIWVRSIGEAERDRLGRIVAVHGAMQDITELVEARHQAEGLSARLLETFESIRDAFMTIDRDWRFTLINSEAAKQLSCNRHAVIGKSIWDVLPESIGGAVWDNFHLAMVSGNMIRFVDDMQGSGKWLDISVFPSPEGLSVYFQDVTAQRANELQLRLLETAVSRQNDALLITDAGCDATSNGIPKTLYVNDAFTRMTGFSPDEIIGKPTQITTGPLTDPAQIAEVEEAIRAQQPVRAELINYTKSGDSYWVELDITPLRKQSGMLTHFVWVQRDISQRKQAEAELRHQNERFHLASRATTDVIWDWDVTTDILWWSTSMTDVFGHELTGTSSTIQAWRDLIHPGDRDRVYQSLLAAAAGTDQTWQEEYRFVARDGRITLVVDRGYVLRDAEGRALRLIGSLSDVTERRDLEARLRQSQRLEAVGQLTGGVAHDFNNLLTVILGNAEILSERLNADPTLRKLAEITADAAERGADLTGRLLAFARKQPLEPKAVDVNALIAGTDGLLRRALSAEVELIYDLADDVIPALVDRSQLESALLNLVLNSRDAMPKGGVLTISTGLVMLDADFEAQAAGRDKPAHAAPFTLLSVNDTGDGMNADIAERAFDPFFTTKELGKGSGLGLSMVYGFVKQSGGHADISSAPGKGTTVRLYLPCAGGIETRPVTDLAATPAAHRADHVLLVEDDPMVLDFVRSQLVSLGYRVTTARNGNEALDLLHDLPDVDLLFTDIVMPGGLNGRDLAQRARASFPDLKVLFTSGYSENILTDEAHTQWGTTLLSKPYRRADLAAKVRQTLDAGIAETHVQTGAAR